MFIGSILLKNLAGVLSDQFEPIYNPSELVQEHDLNSSDEEPSSVSHQRQDSQISSCSCGKCAIMDREISVFAVMRSSKLTQSCRIPKKGAM